jgi:hypothetical protein
LDFAFSTGISGTAELIKQQDGSILAKVTLVGTKPNKLYYGNISSGSAATFTATPILADLKPFANGYSETWLFENYLNQKISYDEWLCLNGHIKIYEVQIESGGTANEVLRGDIGCNVLTGTTKVFEMSPVNGSSISGTLTIQERLNGNLRISTNFSNVPSSSQSSALGLFEGDADVPIGFSQPYKTLTPVNNSGISSSEITGLPGGLANIENYNGFFALRYPGRPDSLIAILRLGNNRPTGASESVTLYTEDSSQTVTVTLREFFGGKWKPTITATNVEGVGPFFLSLHKNAAINIDALNRTALGVSQIAITPNSTVTSSVLRFGQRVWTRDSLLTGDYHLRVDPDTLNGQFLGNEKVPKADIGGNKITTNSRLVVLESEAPYTTIGNVFLRERVNGKSLLRVRLDNTQRGSSYYLRLYRGIHTPGNPISSIDLLETLDTDIPGQEAGTSSLKVLEPKTNSGVAIPYSTFTSGKFFEVALFDDPDIITVSTGNIQ